MKEMIAIIRPKRVTDTKLALEKLGYPSLTAIPVLGRGKQRGIIDEVDVEIRPKLLGNQRTEGMKYIPKRQIILVVKDEDVDMVAQAIIKTNKTGQFGDGKIFICPLDDAVRVRSFERGEDAIF